jgi:DNA-binding MarR family transcriptional regulator
LPRKINTKNLSCSDIVTRYTFVIPDDLTQGQYDQLLQLRTGLRRFLRWSEEQAETHGLTAAQHQLLLAVRGSSAQLGPTISELSQALVLRHHSVVGLVDRAQAAGLVTRRRDPSRHSLVHVRLTDRGRKALRELALVHLQEIAELAPAMQALWQALSATDESSTASSTVTALTENER